MRLSQGAVAFLRMSSAEARERSKTAHDYWGDYQTARRLEQLACAKEADDFRAEEIAAEEVAFSEDHDRPRREKL